MDARYVESFTKYYGHERYISASFNLLFSPCIRQEEHDTKTEIYSGKTNAHNLSALRTRLDDVIKACEPRQR